MLLKKKKLLKTCKKIETLRDAAEAAKEIQASGIAYVVVSMGKNGAILVCGSFYIIDSVVKEFNKVL